MFQTGCSPASAFASFSKQPVSPPREDRMGRNASGLMHSVPDTLASNIPTFPRSVSPASYSPPASPLEGDVVIPCEFCGVALEEAVVFHHQVCHLSSYLFNYSDMFFFLDYVAVQFKLHIIWHMSSVDISTLWPDQPACKDGFWIPDHEFWILNKKESFVWLIASLISGVSPLST